MTLRSATEPADYRSILWRPPREVRWGLGTAVAVVVFFALEPLVPAGLAALGVHLTAVGSITIGLGAYALAVVYAVVVSRRLGLGSLRRDYGLAIRPVDLGIGLLAAIAVEVVRVISGIVLAQATPERPTTNVHLAGSPAGDVVLGVVAVLIAPAVEELVTRGMLMRAIRAAIVRRVPEPSEGRRHLAVDASVLISAAVFTALHLHEAPDLVTAVALVLGIFPIGLVVAWLATRTGRLGPGIVTHALVNALALAAALSLSR
ncbi:MAG TPA: type II CAAX endopeptidase family protein [Amnibacterium sp.]|jgi:membrane protease YdiL (CAAX protease family)|nr:type II CAAX endopeptidase family protein [Amnibacterium sp.]